MNFYDFYDLYRGDYLYRMNKKRKIQNNKNCFKTDGDREGLMGRKHVSEWRRKKLTIFRMITPPFPINRRMCEINWPRAKMHHLQQNGARVLNTFRKGWKPNYPLYFRPETTSPVGPQRNRSTKRIFYLSHRYTPSLIFSLKRLYYPLINFDNHSHFRLQAAIHSLYPTLKEFYSIVFSFRKNIRIFV